MCYKINISIHPLLLLNFYCIVLLNFFYFMVFLLEDFYKLVFVYYLVLIVLLFLFFYNKILIFLTQVLIFLFFIIVGCFKMFIPAWYFLILSLLVLFFVLNGEDVFNSIDNILSGLIKDSSFISFILFYLGFSFLLIMFYCFTVSVVIFFYNNCPNFFLNYVWTESQTFFYLFKYDFNWLIIYAWGIPVLIIMFVQLMVLLFMLSANGYDVSNSFGENASTWYYTNGDSDLLHIHNVVYHPFNVMGSAFKFPGSYLDISSLESGLVYVSSFFMIVVLVLFWILSLFFSMPINWYFLGFLETECVHFDSFFSHLIKYFIILSILSVIFFNLLTAMSLFFVTAFIICFSGNLFVNYNIESGNHYEPIYDYLIGGQKHCIVTPSQFSVYNNVWYYNGIHWLLEETEFCNKCSKGEVYGYIMKV